MEQHAEQLSRLLRFYGPSVGLCKDRFVAHMALLCACYEHHVANRHEIAQRYADFDVEDFEKSFFPYIDRHALGFFVLLSIRKAVADTMKDTSAKRKKFKAAVTVLTQKGSPYSPSEQAWFTATWAQVQEPKFFLCYSLQRSARGQIKDWPREWEMKALTWNSLLANTREVVSGSLAKDWHKFNWWQAIENMLRDRLLSRGLTRQEASHLIAFTWQHFFPEKMEVKYMAGAMRGRWQRAQKK